jgi:hypothetical protein
MSEVQVLGEKELIDHIRRGGRHYDYLVSTGNPRRIFARRIPGRPVPGLFKKEFKKILRFEFFDVEKKDQLGPRRPRRIARRSDVKKAIRNERIEAWKKKLCLEEDMLLEELAVADDF